MKKLYVLLATGLLMASCAQNEEIMNEWTSPDSNDGRITFATYAQKIRTKGIDTKIENLSPLQVTAIGVTTASGDDAKENGNYFTNLNLTSDDNGTTWETGATYFWPSYQLNFFAHNFPLGSTPTSEGDGSGSGNASGDAGATLDTKTIDKTQKVFTYVTGTDINTMTDIVAATALNESRTANGSGDAKAVTLTFKHLMSKISVYASNGNPGAYNIKVVGIKFVNVVKKGTYSFGTFGKNASGDYEMSGFGWTPLASSDATFATYQIDYKATGDQTASSDAEISSGDAPWDAPVLLTKASGDAGYKRVCFNETKDANWMFIPQTLTAWEKKTASSGDKSYIALYVNITTSSNGSVYPLTAADGDYAYAAIPFGSDFEMKQGKEYKFKINFFSGDKGGAGYVDPEDPEDITGDGIDDPGDPIINEDGNNKITFTPKVEEWGEVEIVTINL